MMHSGDDTDDLALLGYGLQLFADRIFTGEVAAGECLVDQRNGRRVAIVVCSETAPADQSNSGRPEEIGTGPAEVGLEFRVGGCLTAIDAKARPVVLLAERQ